LQMPVEARLGKAVPGLLKGEAGHVWFLLTILLDDRQVDARDRRDRRWLYGNAMGSGICRLGVMANGSGVQCAGVPLQGNKLDGLVLDVQHFV
jgi:hypothetical protein